MTQTLKIKRPVVTARYQDIINEMFNQWIPWMIHKRAYS
jgi:hypothetical protein